LPLSRWCHRPHNNGIVALDPQRCWCPHYNGIVAVLKLASLPCFSLQKAAQDRPSNLGLVKNHSCFINNPKRIKLLEQQLELQYSIGRSEEIRKSSALEKKLAEMNKLIPLLSEAIVMYKAYETSKRGFTKDCIKSILPTVFAITPPNSGPLSSKSEWLKLLQQQDKDNPGKIDSPLAANATADLATPATQSNINIHWLYQQCQQEKVNMMADVFPLGMSLVIPKLFVKLKLISLRVRMKMMILIIQMTMQTIPLMHSMTPVCSREEMWISFMNWLKILLD
jgi:hypothetical protein